MSIKHYISASTFARRMDLSVARILVLCNQGRIPGAQMVEGRWLIPADAQITEHFHGVKMKHLREKK